MRRMFGIDKEKELEVEGLCLCVDWSKKKLEAVSASAVNRGMVKGFVLWSQRYLRIYVRTYVHMYVYVHNLHVILGIYICTYVLCMYAYCIRVCVYVCILSYTCICILYHPWERSISCVFFLKVIINLLTF